jgi:hypothetical protein
MKLLKLLFIILIILFVIGLIIVVVVLTRKKKNTDNSKALVLMKTSSKSVGNEYRLLGSEGQINYISTELVSDGFVYIGNSRFVSNAMTYSKIYGKQHSIGGLGVETNNIYTQDFTRQWMYNSKDSVGPDPSRKFTGMSLGDRPLNQILIPGSHDAMTFYITKPIYSEGTAIPRYRVNQAPYFYLGPDIESSLYNIVNNPILLPNTIAAIVAFGNTVGYFALLAVVGILTIAFPIIGPILASLLLAAYAFIISFASIALSQPGVAKAVTAVWAIAQGNSITDQLNMGIRYIDLRMCIDTKSGDNLTNITIDDVRFTHSLITTNCNFVQFINEIDIWITANTHEVVILDFQYLLNLCYDETYTEANKPPVSSGPMRYQVSNDIQLSMQIQILDYIVGKWGKSGTNPGNGGKTRLAPASFTLSNSYNSFLSNGYNFVLMFDNQGQKQFPGMDQNGNNVVVDGTATKANNQTITISNPLNLTFASFWRNWITSGQVAHPYYFCRDRDRSQQSGTLANEYNAQSSPIDFYNKAILETGPYQSYDPNNPDPLNPIDRILLKSEYILSVNQNNNICTYNITLSDANLTRPTKFFIPNLPNLSATSGFWISYILPSIYNSQTFDISLNDTIIYPHYVYIEGDNLNYISIPISNVRLNSENTIQFSSSVSNFKFISNITLLASFTPCVSPNVSNVSTILSTYTGANTKKYYSVTINCTRFHSSYFPNGLNFSLPTEVVGSNFTNFSIDYAQTNCTSGMSVGIQLNQNVINNFNYECGHHVSRTNIINSPSLSINNVSLQTVLIPDSYAQFSITLNTDRLYLGNPSELLILGCTTGIPSDNLTAIAAGIFWMFPLDYGNGLIQQSQNWSPIMINNFLEPYNPALFYPSTDFPQPIKPPALFGNHNIFLFDNCCKFNVCTLLIAANRGELATYLPVNIPTSDDSQCHLSLNSCGADTGYDPSTCNKIGAKCYSTTAQQCKVDNDCFYHASGECRSHGNVSDYRCRVAGGPLGHYCTCDNPDPLASQCRSDDDCGFGADRSYSKNAKSGSHNCYKMADGLSFCATPFYSCYGPNNIADNDKCESRTYNGIYYCGSTNGANAGYQCERSGGCNCSRSNPSDVAYYDPSNYNNYASGYTIPPIIYVSSATFTCGQNHVNVTNILRAMSRNYTTFGSLILDTSHFDTYFGAIPGCTSSTSLSFDFSFTTPIQRTIVTSNILNAAINPLNITSPKIPFQNLNYNVIPNGIHIISATFTQSDGTATDVTTILQGRCVNTVTTIIINGISYPAEYTTISISDYSIFGSFSGIATLTFSYMETFNLTLTSATNSNEMILSYSTITGLTSLQFPLMKKIANNSFTAENSKNNFILENIPGDYVNTYIIFDDITISSNEYQNSNNTTCSVTINVIDSGTTIATHTISNIPYPSNNIISKSYLNDNFNYIVTATSTINYTVNNIGNNFMIYTSGVHYKFNYFPPVLKIVFMNATYANINVLPIIVALYNSNYKLLISSEQYQTVFNIQTLGSLVITYRYTNDVISEVFTETFENTDHCLISEFSHINIKSAGYGCYNTQTPLNVTEQINNLIVSTRGDTLEIPANFYASKLNVVRQDCVANYLKFSVNYGVGEYKDVTFADNVTLYIDQDTYPHLPTFTMISNITNGVPDFEVQNEIPNYALSNNLPVPKLLNILPGYNIANVFFQTRISYIDGDSSVYSCFIRFTSDFFLQITRTSIIVTYPVGGTLSFDLLQTYLYTVIFYNNSVYFFIGSRLINSVRLTTNIIATPIIENLSSNIVRFDDVDWQPVNESNTPFKLIRLSQQPLPPFPDLSYRINATGGMILTSWTSGETISDGIINFTIPNENGFSIYDFKFVSSLPGNDNMKSRTNISFVIVGIIQAYCQNINGGLYLTVKYVNGNTNYIIYDGLYNSDDIMTIQGYQTIFTILINGSQVGSYTNNSVFAGEVSTYIGVDYKEESSLLEFKNLYLGVVYEFPPNNPSTLIQMKYPDMNHGNGQFYGGQWRWVGATSNFNRSGTLYQFFIYLEYSIQRIVNVVLQYQLQIFDTATQTVIMQTPTYNSTSQRSGTVSATIGYSRPILILPSYTYRLFYRPSLDGRDITSLNLSYINTYAFFQIPSGSSLDIIQAVYVFSNSNGNTPAVSTIITNQVKDLIRNKIFEVANVQPSVFSITALPGASPYIAVRYSINNGPIMEVRANQGRRCVIPGVQLTMANWRRAYTENKVCGNACKCVEEYNGIPQLQALLNVNGNILPASLNLKALNQLFNNTDPCPGVKKGIYINFLYNWYNGTRALYEYDNIIIESLFEACTPGKNC